MLHVPLTVREHCKVQHHARGKPFLHDDGDVQSSKQKRFIGQMSIADTAVMLADQERIRHRVPDHAQQLQPHQNVSGAVAGRTAAPAGADSAHFRSR